MSKLVADTLSDIKRGRETWRVLSVFTGASFLISVLTTLAL